MSMAKTLKELRGMTRGQLVASHDEQARDTVIGLNYYLREIERRDRDGQTRAILRCTSQMRWMTVAIMTLTLLNTAAALVIAVSTGAG